MANPSLPINMSISALAAACEHQSDLFRRAAAHDNAYCLELFRRAILRRSSESGNDAWQAIIIQYHRLVTRWVCQYLDCDLYEPEELVSDAFTRFDRSFTSDKFKVYNQLQPILAYLRRCAYTAVCDFQRRQQRHAVVVESLDDENLSEKLATPGTDLEQTVFARMQAENIWRIVQRQCQNEAEQMLARRIFIEGWKPDQVHLAQREYYPSVQAVYSALRNLRDRLRRDPAMSVLLQTS